MENETISSEQETRPASKAELMTRIDEAWSSLQALLAPLPAEQMDVPDQGGWSIKDNLAHLVFWEQLLLRSYLGNEPPEDVLKVRASTLETLDEDGINAIVQRGSRSLPVADVLAASQDSHTQVVMHLDALPFDVLLQPRYPDDPQQRPLLDWVIGNTYDHYREHAVAIAALAERR